MSVSKRVVVVTGAAGGIGQACARTFKNDQLILTDYSRELVDQTVATLTGEGYDAKGIVCDITSKEDVDRLSEFASTHGELKALIHTAGVSGTVTDPQVVFNIDLVGTDLLVDAFYEIATTGSVSVLLSSMMAHTVPADESYDNALQNPQVPESFEIINEVVQGDSDMMYNFSKRGVLLLLAKNVDRWGQKGARIVSVSPGVIETEMALKAMEEHPEKMAMLKSATPLQRNGRPEDVSGVVSFLVSDAAAFITGTDILVDGGVLHNIKKFGAG